MKKRGRIRVWWPEEVLRANSTEDLLLFGWFFGSTGSADVVVACAVPSSNVLGFFSSLDRQQALEVLKQKLPFRLQESSTFSIIGLCTVGDRSMGTVCDSNEKECDFENAHVHGEPINLCNGNQKHSVGSFSESISSGNCATWSCGCGKVNALSESYREVSMRSRSWIKFQYKTIETLHDKTMWVPKLHHIHQNGQISSSYHVHSIVYELPEYNKSHLALSIWGSPDNPDSFIKKPSWVKELHKKPSHFDLGLVLLALNCSSYFKKFFEPRETNNNMSRFLSMVWHLVAVFFANFSTAIYILLQFFNTILSHGPSSLFSFLSKMFPHTWKNVHIRSCQFLYWSIFLKGTGFSAQPNIEYLHKSACKKHFMWSNIAMDVILGIAFCVLLLASIEDVCNCASLTSRDITDNLLRSGCVWLMGIPAGFKLNNELAELLGMISLQAIQIVSAIWFFLSNLLRSFVKLLAISGVIFGFTVPVALSIDMLKIATLHVSTLHWLISFLYSQQIQALASLWRIFRGQKRNPLRQRLDSYDYTVEQHVLGSLLFTPLLLLLPTTSVFYIFFSSLSTTITFFCIMFEIIISILHATPYYEILLWIMARRRFPSGIWFETLYPKCRISDGTYSQNNVGRDSQGSDISVSVICSNYATFGQVITPHYKNIFDGVDPSFGMSLAHGMLSGQRFPSALHTHLPPTMAWMRISCKEYWKLCYDAVLSSRP